MRRITAMFLTLVMCFSFIGEFAYGMEDGTEISASEFVQENQPPVDPMQQQDDPTQQQDDPTQQQDDPTQQQDDPTQPQDDPTQQQDDPTQQQDDPTQQQDDPTQPPVDPTQPKSETETAEKETAGNDETETEEPKTVESLISFDVTCSVESFTAGSPAAAVLTAVVTRTDPTVPFPENVLWESTMPNVVIVRALNDIKSDEFVRTFSTTAEYTGALNIESADITATAPGLGSKTVHLPVSREVYEAKFTDETGNGFRFALKDRSDNTYGAGAAITFVITGSDKPVDKEAFRNFEWEADMEYADGSGAYPVHVKDEENGEFTLYTDSQFVSVHKATGNVSITLKNKGDAVFSVTVGGDADYPTVFAAPKAEEGKDYVFYVAHPEDIENPEKEFESKYAYSLPLVAIGGEEEYYNGYKLVKKEGKISEEDEKSYSKYWEITIPGERITGDILIDANTRRIEEDDEDGYTVDLSLINGKQLVPFSESLSEAGKLTGRTVPNRDDEQEQEYYFYYMKNPENGSNLHPVYFIGNVGYPLSALPVFDEPEAENSSLYKMSDITGDASVTLGYNVSKGLMGNNEEHLIDLRDGEVVLPGKDYTFTVRTFDMTESQLQVFISIGNHGVIYPTGDWEGKISVDKNLEDELGHYAEFTVAASAIDGDITVEAKSAVTVNYRVKFLDNYNVKTLEKDFSPLAYKTFEFASPYFVTYNTDIHTGQFEPNRSGFCFEILEQPSYTTDPESRKPNVDGNSSDAFLAHYNYESMGFGYDFTGSTMGGEPVEVTPGPYIDGHQLFKVNNGNPLTGDVLIKVNLVLPWFEFKTIGPNEALIDSITNIESYSEKNSVGIYSTRGTGRPLPDSPLARIPTYHYRFGLKTKAGQAREVYLSVYNVWTNVFTNYGPSLPNKTGAVEAPIPGDYVAGPIYAKILANDEADVYVKGANADKVSFPNNTKDNCPYYNGCIAKMGEDFVFTVPLDTQISWIGVGTRRSSKLMTEGKEYSISVEGNLRKYTIYGEYMTGDIQITAEEGRRTYSVTFTGKYEFTKPVGKEGPVQFDTVNAGEDYSFLLAEGAVYIYVGGEGKPNSRRELEENRDYVVNDKQITILAASITDDIYIMVNTVMPRRFPMYTSKKKTQSGTELDIETWEYLVLDEEKIMYMLVVRGEPNEYEFVCYGNNKMLWVESYDGYVWFEASSERPEDFAIHSYDMVDTLTEAEIRSNLSEEANDPNAHIEIPEFEELFNITDDDKISCDVNEDGKVDGEDLRIMRRIFNCDFEDFDDISMRCFVLADADNSGVLDMCDAEIIKCSFDEPEEEDVVEDEEK